MVACTDCEARRKMARDALLNAKLGDFVQHVVKGAAEVVGIKEKTGEKERRKISPEKPVNRPDGLLVQEDENE